MKFRCINPAKICWLLGLFPWAHFYVSARISHSVVFPDLRYKKPNFGAADFLFAKNKIKGVKKVRVFFPESTPTCVVCGKTLCEDSPSAIRTKRDSSISPITAFYGEGQTAEGFFSLSQDHGTRFPATKKSFPTPDVRRDFVDSTSFVFPLAAVIRARKENNDKKKYFPPNVNGRRIHFSRKEKEQTDYFPWKKATVARRCCFGNCRAWNCRRTHTVSPIPRILNVMVDIYICVFFPREHIGIAGKHRSRQQEATAVQCV